MLDTPHLLLFNIEDQRRGRPKLRARLGRILTSHLHVPRLTSLSIKVELFALWILDRLIIVAIAQAKLSLLSLSLLLKFEHFFDVFLCHVRLKLLYAPLGNLLRFDEVFALVYLRLLPIFKAREKLDIAIG